MPELEPPVASTGRPSAVASRGSRRGSYGIEREAAERVVVGGHRRGHPVGQLGHRRLGDDDRARLAEVLGQRRLVRRHQPGKRQRAAGGRHVRGVNVVLERDRDAVQRTADASRRGARGRARRPPRARAGSRRAPRAADPRTAPMRASDWATMSRDVTRPFSSASRMSAIVASTIENGRGAAPRPAPGRARSRREDRRRSDQQARVMGGNFT